MGESFEHIKYVRAAHEIAKEFVDNKYHPYIHFDTPESDLLPPQTSEGYRPDIYFCNENILIIGEAKTAKDVDTKHSIAQMYSYIDECEMTTQKAVLILYVPWIMCRTVKKTVRNYRSYVNKEFIIIIADNAGHREVLSSN